MTNKEFQSQIIRLTNTFGTQNFGQERMQMIWNEMKIMSLDHFKEITDELIGNFAFTPLLKDFRELAAKLREREYEKEKVRRRNDVKDFFASKYTPDDKKWIVNMIKLRLEGKVSDEDYTKFIEVLKAAEISTGFNPYLNPVLLASSTLLSETD